MVIKPSTAADKNEALLHGQNAHWEQAYAAHHEMFGADPSEPAKYAAALFRAEGKRCILELGAGQGRDTLFFAQEGFQVRALDYSETAVAALRKKALAAGVIQRIAAMRHDVREPLPLATGSLDACFAHMLFCMAFTTAELAFLAQEIKRVLSPGGFCVYTVRTTDDPHYQQGFHRGEDLYEYNGFIVHFFSKEKIYALADGYAVVDLAEFTEGTLPRKLFRVTLMKM